MYVPPCLSWAYFRDVVRGNRHRAVESKSNRMCNHLLTDRKTVRAQNFSRPIGWSQLFVR